MAAARSNIRFLVLNAFVWLAMVVVLVLVPDWLESWMPLPFARGIGWALACSLWVVGIESDWKARFGPFKRFVLQLLIWLTAALLATWISEQANLRMGL